MRSYPSTVDRRKIIGQEIIKLHTALSLDLVADIIDAKVALAMTDWQIVPTNWLRRTCAKARQQCEWVPKTSEILQIFQKLRNARRHRIDALNKDRERKRLLEDGRMSDESREEFLRDAYRRMGKDYDREKKRERLFKELNSRKQKLEVV